MLTSYFIFIHLSQHTRCLNQSSCGNSNVQPEQESCQTGMLTFIRGIRAGALCGTSFGQLKGVFYSEKGCKIKVPHCIDQGISNPSSLSDKFKTPAICFLFFDFKDSYYCCNYVNNYHCPHTLTLILCSDKRCTIF